ncbi:hypothetical protein FH063_004836 [Azospirillum argentinense]|uniref:Uncharacterized protein n=1 Tax=Azospirillum argentinense TaxID=2970906 RepID=A0A5B0KV56_9PROT|nr:hypothetical protein FH063_004836 [Azospirillum argentinense]
MALHTHLAARQGPLFPTVFDISMGFRPARLRTPALRRPHADQRPW